MHWKLRYLNRHAAQKIVGSVPGLYRLQEAYKSATGHWEQEALDNLVFGRFERNVSRFSRADIKPPRIVFEQGTGWHGADLLFFYLSGAEKIYSYDIRPWLRCPLLVHLLRKVRQLGEIVNRWQGVDGNQLEKRLAALESVENFEFDDLSRRLNVTYCVTERMDRPEIPSGSADLFYSNSVLQRIEQRDLRLLLGESRRILKNGGIAHHIIDTKDFHSINDERVPELGYLGYSEFLWNLMTSKYLNYQNRLRMPDFTNLFQESGFTDVRILDPVTRSKNVEFVDMHLKHDRRFISLSVDEVATTRFQLRARTPN